LAEGVTSSSAQQWEMKVVTKATNRIFFILAMSPQKGVLRLTLTKIPVNLRDQQDPQTQLHWSQNETFQMLQIQVKNADRKSYSSGFGRSLIVSEDRSCDSVELKENFLKCKSEEKMILFVSWTPLD
jgi:hypothetical protein